MHGERGPGAGEVGQADTGPQGCGLGPPADFAVEFLVPHVRRVAHDGVEVGPCRDGEEVGDSDLGPRAARRDSQGCRGRARCVQFDPVQLGAVWVVVVAAVTGLVAAAAVQYPQPAGGCQQERRLTAGGFENAVPLAPDRPGDYVVTQHCWSEECPTNLTVSSRIAGFGCFPGGWDLDPAE